MQNTFYGIINNVDLALNCNSESVYDNNGRYVNELLVYDLCFDLKEHLRIDTDPVYEDNDGIMHYGEYGPFVRFGWEAKRDQDKPGHKGWWSSNNLAVFNVTGVWTIPCVYTYDGCRMACNIKVEDAPMYMPNDYSLVLDGEWNDGHWHIASNYSLAKYARHINTCTAVFGSDPNNKIEYKQINLHKYSKI